MSSLIEEIDKIFSPESPLRFDHPYEFRPQQREMARHVAEALLNNQHLLIEAPTGVGKSLAYLIPAALYAIQKGRKAVISTHTKNLQDQLLSNDVPLLYDLVDIPLRAVMMKGRRNYLCTTRLRNALLQTSALFEKRDERDLEKILAWSETTPDGDIDHLGFLPSYDLWQMVCSDAEVCTPRNCGMNCFYHRMKDQVRNAHVVIMNHALFFTLLEPNDESEGLIFKNDFVILDEAQSVEATAIAALSKRVSLQSAVNTIHRAYNPHTKKGLLASTKRPPRAPFVEAEKAARALFDAIRDELSASTKNKHQNEVRVRSPLITVNMLDASLATLQTLLEKKERDLDEVEAAEVAAVKRDLHQIQVFLAQFLSLEIPSFAHWMEMSGENTALCRAPVEIADVLRNSLFRDDTSVIMTSATLSVDGNLSYFQQKIGGDKASTHVLDSPFQFERQMRLCLPSGMPSPDEPRYLDALPDAIVHCVDRTKGRALVLFTNIALMKAVAKKVRGPLEDRGIELFVQDGSLQRTALLEIFRNETSSVLFGVDSFWSGVDLPGDTLQHVIITRLPFPVPSSPLSEAKMELFTARGMNSFEAFSLPEAILKFRQGVGRLIRTSTDTGIVSILDSRITTRSYGRRFIRSIAPCPLEVMSPDGTVDPWMDDSP